MRGPRAGASARHVSSTLCRQLRRVPVYAQFPWNGYTIGVNVPMNAFDFSVGYAYSKAKNAGATTAKGSAFAAGVTYAMSKRTKLYGGYMDGEVENGAGVTTTDRRLYSIGVRHDF